MKRAIFSILIAFTLSTSEAQDMPSWPKVSREAKAGCRWWWMGSAVDEENLQWQMEQLAEAGIGNLEITPIYGVQGNTDRNIQYLSKEWLSMLKFVKEQGERLDIDIDMTTGTGWPFGGPMVPKEESASKLVTETFDVTGDGIKEQTIKLTTSNGHLQRLVAYLQDSAERTTVNLTSLVNGSSVKWTAPAGRWIVIAAYNQYGVMQVKRPSPGSAGFVVDYFDSTAVANYLKYFDQRFAEGGQPWPHAFFNDSYEINQADWTPRMFEQFEKRRGYLLEDNLDRLLTRDRQVYADYRLTLSDMLRDNFTRQWTRWAHSHGAIARNQAHGSPGNLIDLYAEADIPETETFYLNNFGIKGLRNDKGFYLDGLSSRATLKYASSAAHITGKRLTSSESMTWLTEHFRTSLSQIKPELDLLFTSGINHVIFHGTAYSPQDVQWPGWKFYASIDMSPTNSIWRDAPSMMKYIERVQSFMQMGEPDNDILVYAPFAYAMHRNDGQYENRMALFNINTLSQKMSELEQTVKNLEKLGLDCDYTSERFLMGTTYADGQFATEGGARYKALVIPVSDNLPDSLRNHIEDLQQQGAHVIYGGSIKDLENLTSTLPIRPESMRKDWGVSVIRRHNDTGYHYFMSNLTSNDVDGYVTLGVDFSNAYWYDPMTGCIRQALVKNDSIYVDLRSGESMILQVFNTPLSYSTTHASDVATIAGAVIEPDGAWTLSFKESVPKIDRTYELKEPMSWETLDQETAILMGTGIYETSIHVTAQQLATATAGFRLDLGDVRESARVWLNGEYLGCAWAVPFTLDCGDAVHEGDNTLRIEVTNMPANRISQMDRDGVVWRIFEDINMSNISTASYSNWQSVPSGLNSAVRLIPLTTTELAVALELHSIVEETDGRFYPQYLLRNTDGTAILQVEMTDSEGYAFNDFSWEICHDGSVLLTVTGKAKGQVIAAVTNEYGSCRYAYIPACGAYERTVSIDFTVDTPPGGGWDKLATTNEIKGFSGTGKLQWYRSKLNGREVKGLYNGITFVSEKSNYYFYFPGYGMNTNNDFYAVVDSARTGDLCQVSYLRGEGSSVYEAADSLLMFAHCTDATGLSIMLAGNKSYQVYRSLSVYRPIDNVSTIKPVVTRQERNDVWYNLQGIPVRPSGKGLYLRKGSKTIK